MRITSYGLFWRLNEIEWAPGRGNRDTFRLLGHIGVNKGTVRVADFRDQQGIYILYDEYGPAYVGLTRALGLGTRLRNHLDDSLGKKWDRFSWFGFRDIGEEQETGILDLQKLPDEEENLEDTWTTIGDLEALLIRAIGPKLNRAWMKFRDAEEWSQILWEEIPWYLKQVA